MSRTLQLDGEDVEIPTAYDLSWDTNLNNTIESIVDKVNDLASASAPLASELQAGFMSAAHFAKLENIPLEVLDPAATVSEFQALADSLASTGGIIFCGPHTWNLGSGAYGVALNGSVRVWGCGQGATVFQYTGAGPAFWINNGAGIETLRSGIQDCTIDGVNAGKYGIRLGAASGAFKTGGGTFSNLRIRRFRAASGAGVWLYFSAFTVWQSCSIESNTDGVWFDSTEAGGVTTQSFINVRAMSNDKRGFFVESADTVRWLECYFEDNGEEGALIRHTGSADPNYTLRMLTFDGGYFEDNSTSAANTYSNLLCDTASTGKIIQNLAVRRVSFRGTPGTNIKHHIDFNEGRFFEEDNEFSPTNTASVNCRNTGACCLTSRSDRAPSAYYTLGANAQTTHLQNGGTTGVWSVWVNNAGSAREALKLNQTTALATFVTATMAGSMTAGNFFTGSGGVYGTQVSNQFLVQRGNVVAASTNPSVKTYNAVAITAAAGRIHSWYNDAAGTTAVLDLRKAGDLAFDKSDSSGTPGAATINKPAGVFAFAAGTGAAGIVITNSVCLATSYVVAHLQTNDATAKSVYAVPAAGSFTAYTNANTTGITKVYFEVRN